VIAQSVETILGCDEFPPLNEVIDCAICNDDPFLGTTAPFTPSEPLGWCGTIENDQFIGFASDASGSLVFQVEVTSTIGGEGIQIGVESEDRTLWFCIDQVSPLVGPQTFTFQVPPLTNYFLRIDGFNGDVCDFLFNPISGFRRPFPQVRITNTSGQTQIDYLFKDCATPTSQTETINGCVYEFGYDFIPDTSGSVAISLSPNNLREVFTWADSIPLRARVDRLLTLIEEPANTNCDSFLRFPYFSHFLDLDVYGGLEQGEIWDCQDDRIAYELDANESLSFQLFEGGSQRYVLEAAGLHRTIFGAFENSYFRYQVRQNSQIIFSNRLEVDNFQDTLTIDFSLGVATVQLINSFNTPLEYALTRLDPATPWVPEFSCSQSSFEVCAGEELEATCSLSNAPCVTNTSCYQAISSIEEAQLFAQGSNTPLVVPINTTLSPNGEVALLLDQQSISTLDTGRYEARLTLAIDQSFGGFCADSDITSLSINFEVISSRDTIVLDTLELVPGTGLTIFQDAPINSPQVVTMTGDYSTIVGCALYIQPVVSSVFIELETIVVCPNDCAYTPTGELITCTPGPFSFQASNDTIYTGELIIDNASPLEITSLAYTCDSLTGEWYLDLTWMGSYGPYLFDGQTITETSGRAGPFQNGATIDISLAGASVCVDTIFINGSFNCTSSTTSLKDLGFEIRQLSTSLLEVNAPSYGWQLHLIDILGREVLTTPLQQNANQLFVGDLLTGTYFIVVENGEERMTEKWVKR